MKRSFRFDSYDFMHMSETFACTLFPTTDVEDDEKPHFAPGSPKRVWKPKSQRKAWPMFDMLIDMSIHNEGTLIPTWNRL
jgi:hypothetical protein